MTGILLAAFIAVNADVPLGTNGVSDTARFVKTFTCQDVKSIRSAKWTVSGLGVFRAYLNGHEVGADDHLKPGLTHVVKRRHSFGYDVTALLRSGRNVLAAEVSTGWWRDGVVRSPGVVAAKESGFSGMLEIERIDGSRLSVPTDTSWRAAYGGNLVHAEIYWGETFDARVDDSWRTTGEVDWPSAREYTSFRGVVTPVEGRTIRLRRDLTLQPMRIYVWRGVEGATAEAFGRVKVLRRYLDGERITLMPNETLVVDFGQNAAGVPEIVASAASGTELRGRPAEMLNDGNGERSRGNDGPGGSTYFANYRAARTTMSYVFAGVGEERYMPSFTFFGGRYMSFTADAPVTLAAVRFVPLMSIAPEDETGTIETGLADLNRLISNCVWGMRSNYLSVPTDCPQRDERLGWAGDTQTFVGAAVYAADVYGFLSKWMTDMRDSQMVDGDRHPGSFRRAAPIGPAGYKGYMIGWSDAGIIVPYTLWRQSGDTAIVRANWSAMRRFMDLLSRTGYSSAPDDDQCGDWLSEERYEARRINKGPGLRFDETRGDMRLYWEFLGSCYYIWDLRMMHEMAEAIGENDDANLFAANEDRAVGRFRMTFFGNDGLLPERYRDMQTPAAFLLMLDLPTAEAKDVVRAQLKENFVQNGYRIKTGFLGTSIIMDVLSERMEDSALAYSVLLQHGCPGWLYSVDQGATTIWERWNGYTKECGFGPVKMNSFNHYAYGAVLGWMYRTMAGIRPGRKGGYKTFTLAPKPDRRIGWVKASYRSTAGTIKSEWRYLGDEWIWEFKVPDETTAQIIVPGEAKPKIYSSGTYVVSRKLLR